MKYTGMNTTANESEPLSEPWSAGCGVSIDNYVDLTQLVSVRYAYTIAYIMVSVVAVLGNLLVILTICRSKHMRTVTNYYLLNLAVCDLLVAAFVMPLKLLEYMAPCEWNIFATDILCSALYFLLPVFVFASVLTLLAISLERYYAVVHPFTAMKIHSKSRTRKILASTWLLAILVASPYLYCQHYAFSIRSHLGAVSRQTCTDRFDEIDIHIYGNGTTFQGSFRKGFFTFLFIVVYAIPLVTIVTTCIRIIISMSKPVYAQENKNSSRMISQKMVDNKRKVARMVVVVSTMFVMSWSPFYLTTFVSQMQTVSFLRRANFVFVMLNIHLAGFLNSCLNPFIYSCMSRRFRDSFRTILVSVICCGSPRARATRWGERIQSTYRYTSGTVLNNHQEPTEDREKCIQLTDDVNAPVRRSNGRTTGPFKRNAFEREYTHEEEV